MDEWHPEPLVGLPTADEKNELEKLPVIVGYASTSIHLFIIANLQSCISLLLCSPTGPRCKLTSGKLVVNLGSYNFYNFNANKQVQERVIAALRTYGVGPCGPPQFYGTQDIHMKTEADIAKFLGTEKCIIYAQAFSVISSVIPAFCKRGDVIVADKAVNFSIRRGLEISRSNVYWFNHNNLNELEQIMKRVAADQAAKKKLTRRFIVTEGLFETIGDTIELPCLVELKEKYKFRMILDETWSFGVLGRTGRGITEAQNVDPAQVDMIVGSLAGPLCGGGGFCAGPRDVVEHQRLNGAAYCFSAALPAMLAMTASETINLIASNPSVLATCRENINTLRAQLDPRSDWVTCTSAPENPILLLVIKPEIVKARRLSSEEQERVLQECVEETLSNGVLITKLKTSPFNYAIKPKGDDNTWELRPALKVCAIIGLSKKDIEKSGAIIRHAIAKVMARRTSSKLTVPAS